MVADNNKHERNTDTAAAGGDGRLEPYRPPQMRVQQHQRQQQHQQQQQRDNPVRIRRPDRAVYVPKARRSCASATSEVTDRANVAVVEAPPEDTSLCEDKCAKKPKIKRTTDKSFCNVYTPPHARSSSVRTQVHERSPENGIEDNNSLCLESESVQCDDFNSSAINIDNNVVDGAPFVDANYEHSDNATFDIEKRVNSTKMNAMSADDDRQNERNLIEGGDFISTSTQSDPIIPDEQTKYEKDEDVEQKELIKASEEINRSNRKLIKQSFASDVLIIADNKEKPEKVEAPNEDREEKPDASGATFNPNEDDWETMIDENREWLEPELVEELTATVGRVTIQKPRSSYEDYLNSSPGEFAHVLEAYNFPSEFTTNDLLNVFADFKDTGFEIKWVDDNHALIVFSSVNVASQVLLYNHPLVKTRPLCDATIASRSKAKRSAEFLKPYRARPETCAALARRLVSGALGVKLPNQAQERQEEKEKISLARRKKQLSIQNKEAAWNGSLTSDI